MNDEQRRIVYQDGVLIRRAIDAVAAMVEPVEDELYPVFLSQGDIDTLFFCLGCGSGSGLVTIEAVNRIGKRLSKDFVPYAGATGVDPETFDRGGETGNSGDGGSNPPASTEGN